jgi:LPXTG-motif cell wall-anchored protein
VKLRRTSRRILSALAAVAAGIVGVLVVATPASAHFTTIDKSVKCVQGEPQAEFKVYSNINNNHPFIRVYASAELDNPDGTLTATDLGISPTYTIPTYQSSYLLFTTTPVTLEPGQTVTLTVTLKWYSSSTSNIHNPAAVSTVTKTAAGRSDCTPPSDPDAYFTDDCTSIKIDFVSNVPQQFKATFGDQTEQSSPGLTTAWTITVPASKSPVTAYADGVQIDYHEYTPPQYCGVASSTIETTCDGIKVSLTNPADGAMESVSQTFTPSTGDPKTLTATRGNTVTHTFPGVDGLTVSYTPLGGGDTQIVKWQPDRTKCTTPSPSPSLPNTGSSGLGGIVAAGVALVLAGAGVLALLFLRRRRTITQG